MLRFLLLLAIIVILAISLAPGIMPVLSWVLAFLSLLMLADLVTGSLARLRRRHRR